MDLTVQFGAESRGPCAAQLRRLAFQRGPADTDDPCHMTNCSARKLSYEVRSFTQGQVIR